ncbi:transcription factor WER-like [Iris pallida]|uniref:Transcription factor WER-like n=1 Tax=Iris pallida TaxID=29817 RepID=A0AAX6GWB0_IRIPA|nr:transcription factor WER-like [Iris pallida]
MGRAPCCSKVGLHRGPWTAKEDALLTDFIQSHGEGNWRSLPKRAGLLRCGKSCRLRWMNYLRPDIKGETSTRTRKISSSASTHCSETDGLIAGRLPGRTDNEIKNYWNSHLIKKLKSQGIEVTLKARLRRSKATQNEHTKNKKDRRKKKRY